MKIAYWFWPASHEPTRAGMAMLLTSFTSLNGSMPFCRSAVESTRYGVMRGRVARGGDEQQAERGETNLKSVAAVEHGNPRVSTMTGTNSTIRQQRRARARVPRSWLLRRHRANPCRPQK